MNTAYETPGTGALAIQRLNCAYLAPVDHPDPERLRHRIDDIVRSRLAPLFARALSQTLDTGDESIWLIRNLDVDLAVDVGALDDHALARAWTQQIAMRLARVVSSGEDGEGILHFPNRAAYLAQFGRDLARASAWSKWYYAEFDTLRQLPDGTAFVEALLRQPSLGAQALVALVQGGDFERVLAMLTPRQAERLLDGLTQPAQQTSARDSAQSVLGAWDAAHLTHPLDTWHNRLRLLASVLSSASTLGIDESLRDSLISLTEIAAVLKRDAGLLQRLAHWVTGQTSALSPVSGLAPQTVEWMIRTAQGDAGWLTRVVQVVAPHAAADVNAAVAPTEHTGMFVTHFGGLMHLLGIWAKLDIPQTIDLACASAAEDERPRLAQALRLALAMHGLGPSSAAGLLVDEGALLALGIEPPFSAEELRRILNNLPHATWAGMTAEHIGTLVKRGECEARRMIFDETPGALIQCDADTGYWLDVEPIAHANLRGFHNPESLITAELPEAARRGRPAEEELAMLSMQSAVFETDTEIELHLSMLAHNTLHRLARQLRGFEWSSAAYLRANFLNSIATLSLTSDALSAQLTQPPLGMLLRLAGLGEYRFTLPWWPGREVRVEMELPL